MNPGGIIFYRGPSVLTGAPILGVVTGLLGESLNQKTGPMAQLWILYADLPPMDAKRQGLDDSVCGDCKLRGKGGRDSACYVTPWLGPHNVWKAQDDYMEGTAREAGVLLEDRTVRLGAYGDPVALPIGDVEDLLVLTRGWIGYTHQWRTCGAGWKRFLMASVDSIDEMREAMDAGWRTFRVKQPHQRLERAFFPGHANAPGWYTKPIEFNCPASDEMGHRTTCDRCLLCSGTSSKARSVAINIHGTKGNVAAFYRRRP